MPCYMLESQSSASVQDPAGKHSVRHGPTPNSNVCCRHVPTCGRCQHGLRRCGRPRGAQGRLTSGLCLSWLLTSAAGILDIETLRLHHRRLHTHTVDTQSVTACSFNRHSPGEPALAGYPVDSPPLFPNCISH